MLDSNERAISSLGDENVVAEMLSESSVIPRSESDGYVLPVQSPYMQNRELSWLTFNQRVLDQGADATVPLLERLNFVSIFWSNLQEFFMVRVGSLIDLSLVKKHIIDTKSNMTPDEQLTAIYQRCRELYPLQDETFTEVRSLLSAHGIHHLSTSELNEEQHAFLQDYFANNLMPFLSPQIVNARHPFPHLENGALYVVVRLDEDAKEKKRVAEERTAKDSISEKADKTEKAGAKQVKRDKNLGAEGVTLGLIPMPRQCERIIKLPGEGFPFVLIESVLELMAAEVFSMYTVKHTNIISVARNADIDASDSTDETDDDYREHMKRILKKRSRLAPVRLVSEKKLSSTVSEFLLKRLKLKAHQVFVTATPLDMSYTFGLADRVGAELAKGLVNEPFVPQWPIDLDRNRPIIDQVTEAETLLSYPFESMDAFIQLLREAAVDPTVISIKITLYRLASQSHLAEALISAAENGKDVTALFELRARFDESNNIEWSQRFEQAGAKVIYGFRDFKVHSKICCITRRTTKGIQHITQLGTGNYNEKTAKLYTDLSFITTDEGIGSDATEFFRNMGLENASNSYDVLWVAPLQIKPLIIRGINREIERAKAGEACGLFFKTNSITDKEIIEKIAEASQAGVHVTLFVRGISCIIPGVEGYTDNVRVVSIVGRLLEHSRIYGFGPSDTMDFYLSSADLMTRNMEKRVEIAWPIRNENIRQELIDYIALSLSDTAKLRELKPDKTYTPLGFFAQANKDDTVKRFDSQESLIEAAQAQKLKDTIESEDKIAAKISEAVSRLQAERPASHVQVAEQGSTPPSRPDEQQVNEPIHIPSTSITLVGRSESRKPSILARILRLFVK